jgi:Sel1 repeat
VIRLPKVVIAVVLSCIPCVGISQEASKFEGAGLPLIQAFANQDFQQAQVILGGLYLSGHGVPKDYSAAASWFQRAAARGNATASYFLGKIYDLGLGTSPDTTLAVRWYRDAAEKGNPAAQTVLGVKYLTGNGVDRNGAVAARWLLRAAEQGVAQAQLALAKMFMQGSGLPKDEVAAYAWAKLAEASQESKISTDAAGLAKNLAQAMLASQVSDADKIVAKWKPRPEPSITAVPTAVQQDGISASLLAGSLDCQVLAANFLVNAVFADGVTGGLFGSFWYGDDGRTRINKGVALP